MERAANTIRRLLENRHISELAVSGECDLCNRRTNAIKCEKCTRYVCDDCDDPSMHACLNEQNDDEPEPEPEEPAKSGAETIRQTLVITEPGEGPALAFVMEYFDLITGIEGSPPDTLELSVLGTREQLDSLVADAQSNFDNVDVRD